MMGYDVWNEGAVQECYCPATQAKFREWLKAKYGTVEALGRAWHRYSLGDWESVHPPHGTGGYPDSLDWLRVSPRRCHPAPALAHRVNPAARSAE